MNVGAIIEMVGDEVCWEILRTDGGDWFVWASHNGESDDESFKFCEAKPTLDEAVQAVAIATVTWMKEHGWQRLNRLKAK